MIALVAAPLAAAARCGSCQQSERRRPCSSGALIGHGPAPTRVLRPARRRPGACEDAHRAPGPPAPAHAARRAPVPRRRPACRGRRAGASGRPSPATRATPTCAGAAAEEAATGHVAAGACATRCRSTPSSPRSAPDEAAALAGGWRRREGQGGRRRRRRPGGRRPRRHRSPRRRLRVDANGAWDVDTAVAMHRPPGPLRPGAGRAAGGVDRGPGRGPPAGTPCPSPPTSACAPRRRPPPPPARRGRRARPQGPAPRRRGRGARRGRGRRAARVVSSMYETSVGLAAGLALAAALARPALRLRPGHRRAAGRRRGRRPAAAGRRLARRPPARARPARCWPATGSADEATQEAPSTQAAEADRALQVGGVAGAGQGHDLGVGADGGGHPSAMWP